VLSRDIGNSAGLTELDLTGRLNPRINQRPNDLGRVEPTILAPGRWRTLRSWLFRCFLSWPFRTRNWWWPCHRSRGHSSMRCRGLQSNQCLDL